MGIHGASTEETTRLDSSDGATVLFDLWTLVDGVRQRKQGERLVVRASAQAAGRRQRRSPWRRRWVIEPGQHSLRSESGYDARATRVPGVVRSVARQPDGINRVGLAWAAIHNRLDENTTRGDLSMWLESVLGSVQSLKAYGIHEAFHDRC